MSTEDNITITDQLAALITQLLDSKLNDNKRRAYPMPEIYQNLEQEIKAVYPETDRYKFQKALSMAIKNNRLPGYEVKLGKNGGVGKVDYKKPGTEIAPQTLIVQESSSLEFNGRPYRVSFSKESLEKLLTKVFRVQEDPEGDLIFDDRRFLAEGSETRECIDNLLFYFTESNQGSNEQEAV